GSTDPERDELDYSWDFHDGTTSSDADPEHVFEEQQSGDVTVTLTCSDGQLSAMDSAFLQAVPMLAQGKTPGLLHIDSATPLEFGGIAVGANATKTITLSNTDDTPTSQVKVELDTTLASFGLSTTTASLGPGESQDVTITFAPSTAGHQHARVSLVAAASS